MTQQDESDLRDIEVAMARGRPYALEAVARMKRRTEREARPFKAAARGEESGT
jgi:hypothetical protein